MTITLPLEPREAARIAEIARAKGLTPEALLRQVVDQIIHDSPAQTAKEPSRSLRGLLAKYGPPPSAEDIDENRAEMFANFPRSGF